jgi:F1F0 ATPase subunit 2
MEALTMEYAAVFIAGILLGFFYFGGLWLTTRALTRLPREQAIRPSMPPALQLLMSFASRMGVTLAFLYWLMQGNWRRALVALLGMLLARFLIKFWIRTRVVEGGV